jgi:hypothetical protein
MRATPTRLWRWSEEIIFDEGPRHRLPHGTSCCPSMAMAAARRARDCWADRSDLEPQSWQPRWRQQRPTGQFRPTRPGSRAIHVDDLKPNTAEPRRFQTRGRRETSLLRLSALILPYFSTLKGIFHPGQRGFLLYPIILHGHNYSIYLPYINYHIPPSTVCTRPFSRFATRWGQHIKSWSLIGPSTALHAPLPTPVPMVSLAHVCVDAGFGVLELERDNRVAYPAPHCSPPLHAKILAQPFQLPLRAA